MTQNGATTCQQSGTELTRENLALFLTRSSLIGIQRGAKDPIRFQKIGTLLGELKTLETATGDHRKRLDRYIEWQVGLLAG